MKDKKNSPFDAFATPTQLVDPTAGAAAIMALGGTLMQTQMEFFGLISRRMRAQMDLPRCMAACQNLPELAEVQKQFLQHASGDYTEYAQHLSEVWSTTTPNLLSSMGQGNKAPQSDMAQMTEAMTDVIKRSFSSIEAISQGAWSKDARSAKGATAGTANHFQPWWLMQPAEQNRSQSSPRSGRNGSGAHRSTASNGRAAA